MKHSIQEPIIWCKSVIVVLGGVVCELRTNSGNLGPGVVGSARGDVVEEVFIRYVRL